MRKIKGLYYCQDKESIGLIRFFEDLKVINVSTSASFKQIPTVLTWFNPSHKTISQGIYKLLDDDSISFDFKNDLGTNEYKGIIDKNKISFKIYCHWNLNGTPLEHEREETYILYEDEMDIIESCTPSKKYNLAIFERIFQEYFSSVISLPLRKKLETAYEYYVANLETPYIISEIQYNDLDQTIFLIAKNPHRDVYHGILKNKFIKKIEIVEIPVANITWGEFKEIPIEPFLAKPYIESGIRIK